MPQPAIIDSFTPEQRHALEQELILRNFKDYDGLVSWAAGFGLEISRASAHRYGQKLKRRLAVVRASTEAARQIAEAAPDDTDLRSAAVISLVQSELFELLLNLQEAEATDDPQTRVELMAKAARGVADLSRASVGQKKWQADTEAKVRAEAAKTASQVAKSEGVSELGLARIRAALGIQHG